MYVNRKNPTIEVYMVDFRERKTSLGWPGPTVEGTDCLLNARFYDNKYQAELALDTIKSRHSDAYMVEITDKELFKAKLGAR